MLPHKFDEYGARGRKYYPHGAHVLPQTDISSPPDASLGTVQVSPASRRENRRWVGHATAGDNVAALDKRSRAETGRTESGRVRPGWAELDRARLGRAGSV